MSETKLLVVDYFPEFHRPLLTVVPEAIGARYVGQKWTAQIPREKYDEIVDRLIDEGFDVAPEKGSSLMLYDASGQPIGAPEPAGRTVEIARSFSFKLNLGNYESADFFCSQKSQCDAAMAEEVSADLYEFCVDQVQAAIRDFKERRERKAAQRSNAA